MENVVGRAFIKDGRVVASPFVYRKEEKIPEKLDEFRDMIKDAIYASTFSSRILGKDSFTHKMYKENEVVYEYINGVRLIYYIPGGLLTYYKDNSFMMKCANIEFMVIHDAIPYKNTNIENKLLVKRSSGFLQHGVLSIGNSFKIYKNKNTNKLDLKLTVCFNQDEKLNIEFKEDTVYDCSKSIYLCDYFDANPNCKSLTFTFEKLENITHENKVYEDSIEMYNKILYNFAVRVNEVILLNDYPITIVIN